MGHTERHLVFNRREVDQLQRRLMSFLLIFTAVAIAFIVVVASMQTRVATCQTQAAEGIRPLYMHHGTSNTTVRDAIFASLSLIGVRAEPVLLDSGAQNTQLDVFDTTEGTLSTSGFRLVRETGLASVAYWKLLYMDHSVCSPERGISMEALPNVDYEKVTYRVKAIVSNNMRLFLYETNIATKNKERITTFSGLQSVFPGFNSKVGTQKLVLKKSVSVKPEFIAELYHGPNYMNVDLRVEEMQIVGKGTPFWRVLVVSNAPVVEESFNRVFEAVAGVLLNIGALCTKGACGANAADDFLL